MERVDVKAAKKGIKKKKRKKNEKKSIVLNSNVLPDMTNEMQWVNRFICCSDVGATKQTSRQVSPFGKQPSSSLVASRYLRRSASSVRQ